jgi:citrate lyase subunit beta / citryl-CoA lyase
MPQPDLRKVRSILSVPAHDERKVSRARSRGADLIMWDLEDSVPFSRKYNALCSTARSVVPGDMVRINHPHSLTFEADARILREAGVTLIMVPKVSSVLDLKATREAFGPNVGIIACIESPKAVVSLPLILADSPPLAGLAFGPVDFAALSPPGSADLLAHAALQISLAAAALGIHATDGPCYNLDSSTELSISVERSRRQGFNSKCAIHPDQIEKIRDGMGPSKEEIFMARGVLSRASQDSGDPGVLRLGFGVVAPPTIRGAQRLLDEVYG